MDRKTLEYMEERATKARKICDQIDRLCKSITLAESATEVKFWGYSKPGVIEVRSDIVPELLAEYKELAQKKIEQLEQELAAL